MRVRYGMAHGRFQPFHRGHLEYVLAASARSDHLIIGITNPDPWQTRAEAADAQRHTPEANPFTFFERQRMIRAALHAAGMNPLRVSLVPFSIHEPERWAYYCPRETVQFVRVFSAWGREKVARLRTAGWQVEVLDAGHAKQVGGRTVRQRLRENRAWRDLVPPGVAAVLDEIGAPDRCSAMAESGIGRSDEKAVTRPVHPLRRGDRPVAPTERMIQRIGAMQILFVILDGLADRPQAALDGKTPLDAAHTPHLDRLAECGTTGLLTPLAPGVPVESDTSHFLLFGYDLEQFPGRAAFEAIGRGIDVPAGSVVLLASFAQTSVHDGTLRRDALMWVTARRGDEADCDRLARAVAAFETHGVRFRLEPCGRGEAILTLTPASGENVCPEVSRAVSDVDPFYDGASVARCQPLAEAPRPGAARRTADALNAYLGWAHARLSAHPLNRRRTVPIDFLLTKWAAVRPEVPPFIEQNGLRAASVEDYPLYVGIARVCGMTSVGTTRRNSSDVVADFGEKLRLADDLFAQGYEFVHVHSKAPDVAAHRKDPRAKQRAIEALDSALGPLVAEIGDRPDRSNRLVVVTGDHATPSSGPLIHSGEAVPLLIVGGPNVLPDDVTAFSERTATRGGLGHVRGRDVMPLLLNYTDRARLHGVRHEPAARPY